MTRTPHTALRVADLAASLACYVERLGLALEERDDAAGLAVVSWRGYRLLLAGPGAEIEARVPSPHAVVRPGAIVFLDGGDSDAFDVLSAGLAERGVAVELVERPWGERRLRTRDPDGYTVAWWSMAPLGPEEILRLYESGPDALEAALAGLSAADLDRAPAPGAWTPRQIVHHLADSECAVLLRTKAGLAEPGRSFTGNPYLQDAWAAGLDYAGRDIAPSIALFRAIRAHIGQLMRHLPDAWQRDTISPDGAHHPPGPMLQALAAHALEHIEALTPPPAPRVPGPLPTLGEGEYGSTERPPIHATWSPIGDEAGPKSAEHPAIQAPPLPRLGEGAGG